MFCISKTLEKTAYTNVNYVVVDDIRFIVNTFCSQKFAAARIGEWCTRIERRPSKREAYQPFLPLCRMGKALKYCGTICMHIIDNLFDYDVIHFSLIMIDNGILIIIPNEDEFLLEKTPGAFDGARTYA